MEIRETFIPVLRPVGGQDEISALSEVIESGWWGKGAKVSQFEQEFARMVGAKHALAVTSNTAGLDLVFKALGLRGVEIVSPTMSFLTTGVVPLWNQCSSKLADVVRDSLCIDPADVRRRLSPGTGAVIAVNYSGVPADIDSIREFFDGPIIEDCAHSCYVEGAGSKGDVAVWSFQAVKTLPTGDGGMITLNDSDLYERLVRLSWMGITSTYERTKSRSTSPSGKPGYTWDYEVSELGYKAYMTDLTAAIGLVQMGKLKTNLDRRLQIQTRYNTELPHQVGRPPWSGTVQHYVARVKAEERDNLMDFLSDKKIHTSVHYKPLHLHPILSQAHPLPVADDEWKKIVSLPCHPHLTEEDLDYVIFWINQFFRT